MTSPKIINIFIASSAELKQERDDFRNYIATLNDKLLDKKIYLKLVQWEHFLDIVSDTRLQDKYNQALRNCDIALCLFFTRVGKFSEEEFDTAYAAFKANGKPKILTYFKNAPIDTGDITENINTLLAFKAKLSLYGHFVSEYSNTPDLHNKFREQLDILMPEVLLPVRKKRKPIFTEERKPVATAEAGVQTTESNRSTDEIDNLLETPTEENISKAVSLLSKLTKDSPLNNSALSLKAELIQYRENKLSGFNMDGKINVLIVRLNNILREYKISKQP